MIGICIALFCRFCKCCQNLENISFLEQQHVSTETNTNRTSTTYWDNDLKETNIGIKRKENKSMNGITVAKQSHQQIIVTNKQNIHSQSYLYLKEGGETRHIYSKSYVTETRDEIAPIKHHKNIESIENNVQTTKPTE